MLSRKMMNYPFWGWSDPFAQMDRMAWQMNALSNAILGKPAVQMFPSKVYPAVNITEDKERYFVRAELPGITADELEVQVNGKNLTISGERKIKSEGEDVKYHRREREAGKFSRVIGLPGEIDQDGVNARVVNGMLTVEIPKSEAARPKQITVH